MAASLLAAFLAATAPARALDAAEPRISPCLPAAPNVPASLKKPRRPQAPVLREARVLRDPPRKACWSIACPGAIILGVGF